MEIWQILTVVFGLLAIVLGVYWSKTKLIIGEIGELFTVIAESLRDDTLTKDELELIVSKIKDILNSFKPSTIKNATTEITKMRSDKVKNV